MAVTNSSEQSTLAESTIITAHGALRFTASPQGNTVGRRRRPLLHTIFVLKEKERERRRRSYNIENHIFKTGCCKKLETICLWSC